MTNHHVEIAIVFVVAGYAFAWLLCFAARLGDDGLEKTKEPGTGPGSEVFLSTSPKKGVRYGHDTTH